MGYKVATEVKVEVEIDGEKEIRTYDIVAYKGDLEKGRFMEIKTFEKPFTESKVPNRVARRLDNWGDAIRIVTRGSLAQRQVEKDRAFMEKGGTVLRTGKSAQPTAIEWHGFAFHGTTGKVTRLPPMHVYVDGKTEPE